MRNRIHGMFGAVGSLVIAGASLLSFNAEAAIVHDEAVHGDLSDDHARPTAISLAVGDNLIKGSTTHPPTLDRDFFTITIPDGHSLDAIVLAAYTNTDDQSFFGWTRGGHFRGMGFTDVSGWALIGALPGLSVGEISWRFSPAISSAQAPTVFGTRKPKVRRPTRSTIGSPPCPCPAH